MKSAQEYINYYDNVKDSYGDNWGEFNLRISNYFIDFDPYELTWDDLIKLGFTKWDDEETILLIPSHFSGTLKEGIKVTDLEGNIIPYSMDLSDTDEKFLPFGILKELM